MNAHTLSLRHLADEHTPKERREHLRTLVVNFANEKARTLAAPAVAAAEPPAHPFSALIARITEDYGATTHIPKLVTYLRCTDPKRLADALRYTEHSNVEGLSIDTHGQLVLAQGGRDRVLMRFIRERPEIVGFFDTV
jgi:hypothetical protein